MKYSVLVSYNSHLDIEADSEDDAIEQAENIYDELDLSSENLTFKIEVAKAIVKQAHKKVAKAKNRQA